jgi:hypothetical protein
LRDGRVLRRIQQLTQREADGQEQREDLETVKRPAEVRGDQHLPLRAAQGAVPRQWQYGFVARHGRLPPVFIVVSVFTEAIASFVPQYRGRRGEATTGAITPTL